MIGFYKISTIGTDHLEKPNGVCQDYSDVLQMENGYTIAVIADGLGSASKSDIGSKTAVEAVLHYIQRNIQNSKNDDFYLKLLQDSYVTAYNSVIEYAKKLKIESKEFNTTLTTALYDGKTLFYGQCGDGGIIALTYDGDYVCVTNVSKGEAFNETFPLLGGAANWSFGKFDGRVCALTMMTDGIFDIVCHPLLANEDQKINIPFIRRFMDRNILKANDKNDFVALQGGIERFVRGTGLQGVTDDKTIVGLINTKVMPKLKDDEYYKEPDWDDLNKKMKEKLKERQTEHIVRESVQNNKSADNLQKELEENTNNLNKLVAKYNESKKINTILRKIVLVQITIIIVLVIALCVLIKHNKNSKENEESSNSSIVSDGKDLNSTDDTNSDVTSEIADEKTKDKSNVDEQNGSEDDVDNSAQSTIYT